MNFLAIDFETGDHQPDSAISIGLVRVEGGQIVSEAVRLIRPPREKVLFTSIHGLRWEDVCGAPTFAQLWPEIRSYFDGVDFLVAHNAPFDRKVLHSCCEVNGIAIPTQAFQCTVQVARRAFQIFPTKLSNVCQTLGIELNHHEALSDARAAAKIYLMAALKEQESSQVV
jgi:DNA polymerase III subunit epsilon